MKTGLGPQGVAGDQQALGLQGGDFLGVRSRRVEPGENFTARIPRQTQGSGLSLEGESITGALEHQVALLGRETARSIVAAANDIQRIDRVVHTAPAFHPPPKFMRRFLQGGYMFSHKTYVAGMTSGPGYYPTSIVSNDHRLYANTLYAFEPHTSVAVPGWPEHGVEIGMGQIVVMRETGLDYLDRSQQSEWHIVK